MLNPKREQWQVSGGELPTWMRRVNKAILACTVLLGLAFASFFWFQPIEGPVAVERIWLKESSTIQARIPLGLLLVMLFFAACAAYTIFIERRDANRFEPFVIVGACLVVSGQLILRNGMRWLHDGYTELPAGAFHSSFFLLCLGVSSCLVGLVSLAVRGSGRGALVGVCSVYIPLLNFWWVHQEIVAPDWAQPETRFEVTDLAVAPGAARALGTNYSADLSVIEIKAVDGRDVILAEGNYFAGAGYPLGLQSFASNFAVRQRTRRDGTSYSYRRAWLSIHASRRAQTGTVLEVLEEAAAVGIERFALSIIHTEPWIQGDLDIYGPSEFFGSNEEALLVKLFTPYDTDPDTRPVIHFGGRVARSIEELIPRPPGGRWSAAETLFDMPRVVVQVDPGLPWQQTVTALDALNCNVRIVFLERLED